MSKQEQPTIHPTPIVIIDIDDDETVRVNRKPIPGHPDADTAYETAIWYVAEHYAADIGRPVQTYAHLPARDTARINITPDARIEKLPIKTPTGPMTPIPAAAPTHTAADAATDSHRADLRPVPDTNDSSEHMGHADQTTYAGTRVPGEHTRSDQTTETPGGSQVKVTQPDLDMHDTTIHLDNGDGTESTADSDTPANDSSESSDGVAANHGEDVWHVDPRAAASSTPNMTGHAQTSGSHTNQGTITKPSVPWPGPSHASATGIPDHDATAGEPGQKDSADSGSDIHDDNNTVGQDSPTRLNLHELAREQQHSPTQSRWRRLLWLGPSKAEQEHQARLARVQTTPATGSTFVGATLQIKGGDGKTTSALLTSQAIAENTGLAVVAVSADPANGNLLQRAVNFDSEEDLIAHPTAIDLYEAEMQARNQGRIGLTDAHAIGRHLALAGRLRVLGAQQIIEDDSNDDTDTGLKAHQVDILIQVLSRVFDVIIFDCGTALTTAAFKTLLRLTHGVILVCNPGWDILEKGQQSLDFIEYRRPDILSRATLACVDTPVHARSSQRPQSTFDLEATISRLGTRLTNADNRPGRQPVAHVPYDPTIANGTAIHWPHLKPATQRAALDLAGQFADLWAGKDQQKGQPT